MRRNSLQELRSRVQELEREKEQIVQVCATFACFLKFHAIAPYNDAIADYLDHLIKVERGNVQAGGNRQTLDGLEAMLSSYEKEKEILDDAVAQPDSGTKPPSPEDVNGLVESLYRLKINGPQLQQAMRVADESARAVARGGEKCVNHQVGRNRQSPSGVMSRTANWGKSRLNDIGQWIKGQ